MERLPRILIPFLILGLAACGDEPEPEYTRPPEYRNPAAEYLLSAAAKREVEQIEAKAAEDRRREALEAAMLDGIPEGFPTAFTAFPGMQWGDGFDDGSVALVSISVAEPLEAAYDRLRGAAESDGWALEVVVESGEVKQLSFQREAQRAEVFLSPLADSRTGVFVTLTRLERAEPAAEAAP